MFVVRQCFHQPSNLWNWSSLKTSKDLKLDQIENSIINPLRSSNIFMAIRVPAANTLLEGGLVCSLACPRTYSSVHDNKFCQKCLPSLHGPVCMNAIRTSWRYWLKWNLINSSILINSVNFCPQMIVKNTKREFDVVNPQPNFSHSWPFRRTTLIAFRTTTVQRHINPSICP